MQIPLAGEAYTSLAAQYSAQTSINWYRSVKSSATTTNYSLRAAPYGTKYEGCEWPTPGTSLLKATTGSQVRGMLTCGTTLYYVVDNTFYSLTTANVRTSLGTLLTSSGRCSLKSNLTQIRIDDGTYGYVYTPSTTTFARITDSNFIAGTHIAYMDGYAAHVPNNNSNVLQLSTLNNFSVYDATLEATPESSTLENPLVTCETSHLELWLLGTLLTEVQQNAGTIPFPFARVGGVLIEYGCAAAQTVVNIDNGLMWLGRNNAGQLAIIKCNNYTPLIVSTEAIHHEFQKYTTISDAFAYSYINNGHLFYVLTFPSEDKTWVFDCATTLWHQWATFRSSTGINGRHLSNCYAFFNNQHVVGDYASGNLYTLSDGVYTDNSNPIVRERTFPTIANDGKLFSITRFDLDFQKGVGRSSGQGVLPRFMLSISRDSGMTFGTEMLIDMGAAGQTQTLARVCNLGQGYNFTARIKVSDPVFAAPFAALVDIEAND